MQGLYLLPEQKMLKTTEFLGSSRIDNYQLQKNDLPGWQMPSSDLYHHRSTSKKLDTALNASGSSLSFDPGFVNQTVIRYTSNLPTIYENNDQVSGHY
jgi:hypothetical protein